MLTLLMRLRVKKSGARARQSVSDAEQIASKGTSGQSSEVSFVRSLQLAAKQRSLFSKTTLCEAVPLKRVSARWP